MMRLRRARRALCLAAVLSMVPAPVFTHSGPPFPIVSDHQAGPYRISIWTDPDATDDGSAAGQFWLMVDMADGSAVPPDTHASIEIRPLTGTGPTRSVSTSPVNGEASRQFAAVPMDHEGPFAVRATVAGSRGNALVDTTVDATYDLRPARWLIGLYLLPFLAVGFLWVKLLVRRRRDRTTTR